MFTLQFNICNHFFLHELQLKIGHSFIPPQKTNFSIKNFLIKSINTETSLESFLMLITS